MARPARAAGGEPCRRWPHRRIGGVAGGATRVRSACGSGECHRRAQEGAPAAHNRRKAPW